MNSGSKLRFPKRFVGDARKVRLQGEAFFHVAQGGVPFNVITENATTQVLGTQFNVWARKGETRVVVKEGCVKLSAASDESNHVVLKKDEMNQVVGDNAPGETRKVDADRLLGWIENRLTFESVPLEEVVEELERFHDIRIRIDNHRLARYPMTGEFHNMTVQKILESICLTLEASFRKEGEIYVIF
jgi:ferric-dicitrate binding protein FerR (iron transport regulator)